MPLCISLDLNRRIVSVRMLNLVAQADEVGLCLLSDIVVALEKGLILPALDGGLGMVVAVGRLDQLRWRLLVERLNVDVTMLVLDQMLRAHRVLRHGHNRAPLTSCSCNL